MLAPLSHLDVARPEQVGVSLLELDYTLSQEHARTAALLLQRRPHEPPPRSGARGSLSSLAKAPGGTSGGSTDEFRVCLVATERRTGQALR